MRKKFSICITPLALFGVLLILTNACKKEDNSNLIPVLTTSAESNIMVNTATGGGNITSDGGATVTSRGVCWSTDITPTISDNQTTDGAGIGSFTSNITDLIGNTRYYVRAYATNNNGTGYGGAISFITAAVADIDGNVYYAVTIGTQVWLVENLKTTKYSNGDPIPNVTGDSQWNDLITGAYCNYDNNDSNATTYGRLYNSYAVKDNRKIAPTGWHVPSDQEWTVLTDYFGGESIAGGKLKETGTEHWYNPNTGATNESGFTGLPGGFRYNAGWFDDIGRSGSWWTSTEDVRGHSWERWLYYGSPEVDRSVDNEALGFSIRCIKD
jgi:uncharacterized protein (TIGR02145 family)